MTTSWLRWAPVFLPAVLGCAPASDRANNADSVTIRQIRETEAAALNAGQLDNLVGVYSTDVHFMPPNAPEQTGGEAVRSWAGEMLQQFAAEVRYTGSAIEFAGDHAIERYTGVVKLTPKAGGPSTEERMKGIHIYRRQPDGSWRIAVDVWNSDGPPPATTVQR
jgi:ketosteroid isomerase-like protein